jgi:hypothetical protein
MRFLGYVFVWMKKKFCFRFPGTQSPACLFFLPLSQPGPRLGRALRKNVSKMHFSNMPLSPTGPSFKFGFSFPPSAGFKFFLKPLSGGSLVLFKQDKFRKPNGFQRLEMYNNKG